MRRVTRLAGLTLAAVMVMLGGIASPASAATHRVKITGARMVILDDDKHDKKITSVMLDSSIAMPKGDSWNWWDCADDEVRGDVDFSVEAVKGSPNDAAIYIGVNLYEQENCGKGDWENSEQRVFTMGPNDSTDVDIMVRTKEKCGRILKRHRCADYVHVTLTITNEVK